MGNRPGLSGRPSILTSVPVRGAGVRAGGGVRRWKRRSEGREEAALLVEEGPRAEGCRRPPGAGKGQEGDRLWSLRQERSSDDADFSPVRLLTAEL